MLRQDVSSFADKVIGRQGWRLRTLCEVDQRRLDGLSGLITWANLAPSLSLKFSADFVRKSLRSSVNKFIVARASRKPNDTLRFS